MTKDFFVSYNKADRSWAEWIAWELEEKGYSTIIQAWDFRPGGNFVLEMQNASAETLRTVAVLSPDYLEALFTQAEWAAAFAQDAVGQKRTLIPVRVRECGLKGLLAQIIYVDLVGLNETETREELLSGIREGRAKPESAPAFPGSGVRHSVHKPDCFPGGAIVPCAVRSLASPPLGYEGTINRYRQEFPRVRTLISIHNEFAERSTFDYEAFREIVQDERLLDSDSEGWPWLGPPPLGGEPLWTRHGVLAACDSSCFWNIRITGEFTFCTDELCWEDQPNTVGIRTLLRHLLFDLTYGARIAAALNISGPGGRAITRIHGALGHKIVLEQPSHRRSPAPTCAEENPSAYVPFDFTPEAELIRDAAVTAVHDLLLAFLTETGGLFVNESTLQRAAEKIQKDHNLYSVC